ncbi:hypothetical protein SAMN05421543_12321 [Alicyclobacillus macrosporangiidus]|uniref:Uncharacterized protein n=1 Tax=Alicyclobacillus macrosporangiidus TaxID=392015 RepID=A0A1I7L2H5_9BACL|nr:hypothetical protein SAMN05421543_12321 [Alicyclobacillus macrosporangiidus]
MRSIVIAGLLLILAVSMYAGAQLFFNNQQSKVQNSADTAVTQAIS